MLNKYCLIPLILFFSLSEQRLQITDFLNKLKPDLSITGYKETSQFCMIRGINCKDAEFYDSASLYKVLYSDSLDMLKLYTLDLPLSSNSELSRDAIEEKADRICNEIVSWKKERVGKRVVSIIKIDQREYY